MTESMEALFLYAMERRFGAYRGKDPTYRDSSRCADRQETLLRAGLDNTQMAYLDTLLDELQTMHGVELESIFQAGFDIAMELNR